jgi:hypothetical protein
MILEDLALKMRKWHNKGDCTFIGMDAKEDV